MHKTRSAALVWGLETVRGAPGAPPSRISGSPGNGAPTATNTTRGRSRKPPASSPTTTRPSVHPKREHTDRASVKTSKQGRQDSNLQPPVLETG
jgi:hypothetical protein